MPINTIQTRIQLKYDTLAHWMSSTFVPMKGEVCIAEIPTGATASPDGNTLSNNPPAIGIKIGDGVAGHTFSVLPWIQAIAGDVYSWAKAATKPTYTASEIENIDSYIAGQIQDTDTQYRIQEGTGEDAGKYFLQSKAKGTNDSTYTTVSTIDLSSVQNALEFDGTYDASTNKVATQSTVTNAISGLTDTLTGTPGAAKTITAFDEVDGKITATFSDIAIAESQVTNLTTDLATKAPINSPDLTGTPTAPTAAAGTNTTQIATTAFVHDAVAGLSGAMHYQGEVEADPTQTTPTGTYNAGDVVTYGNSEYVYDGASWRELGDEGSYALKTTTVTGTDGLTGGGAISSNQTISHAVPSGATASTKGTAGGRTYIQTITTDKFGHITGVATATETVTDTTYTFAEGSVNGEFSVTPLGGTASQVKVHGLDTAAYKDVSTSIPASGTADDAKLPTVAAVKAYASGLVTDLDSSQSATAANGDVYSVLTGITQTDGELSGHTEVTLAKIAKTGSIYDVTEGSNTTTTGSQKYLVLDCGSASILVD